MRPEKVVSNPFWQVLGRCCCQDEFRQEIFVPSIGHPELDPRHMDDRLEGIHDKLVAGRDTGFRLSRHDFMEINAILRSRAVDNRDIPFGPTLGSSEGAIKKLRDLIFGIWEEVEPLNTEVWEFVGLCCCDHIFLADAVGKSDTPGKFLTFLNETPPWFALGADTEKVRALLISDTGPALMDEVDTTGWRLVRDRRRLNACATGFERTFRYRRSRQNITADAAEIVMQLLEGTSVQDLGNASKEKLVEFSTKSFLPAE